ncbi:hypothetical protein KC19_3G102400 [Ceratodon purpureus]|uniref:PNPLA domain-containing protein n=1 Tax=Ceratodon purpureus TaxID=3225 RepID=A0A8T0IKP3_CERPU|nr:hypothetical protein KC19_3G102400 [Ceratodon purpureus]
MDYSDDADAALEHFAIGPLGLAQRVVAFRILFCRWVKKVRIASTKRVEEVWKVWRRVFHRWLRGVSSWLNPRNPSVILLAAVVATMLLRRAKVGSQKAERAYKRKFWSNLMKTALTYEEWAHAARMLEKEETRRKDSDLYDEDLVRSKLNELRLRRLEGGVEDILFCIRADLVRNLGNMCNPELHKGRLQTPRLIQEYINEVRYHLRAVCSSDSDSFTLDEKIAFIHETRHGFGRTALLLSGGAALGSFHLGVVRTLVEHRLLPRVVAGASVGSIICSFVATRTWSELQNFFDDPMPPLHFFENMGSIFATAHRLLTRGALQEIGLLQRLMRQLIGDLTFQEAYDLSGRVLGISVCSPRRLEPPRCLNYLTSPHVVIWSAVTASCAFPGLFEAQELMAKDRTGHLVPYHSPPQVGPEDKDVEKGIKNRRWRDGSLESDLPMMLLKELFNVNHFIVSQANPHIAPFLRFKDFVRAYGGDFAAKLAHLAEMEVKHRCKQVMEMGFELFGLAKLFAQDWEGDVTIVMPATFAQFAKLISNPSPTELRKAVMQGRRATWAKLSAIQANCGIELMLDECVTELNRRRKVMREMERSSAIQSHGGNMGRRRIPSWNHLARENSCGSLDEVDLEGGHGQLGGPWGGPSMRTLRPVRITHDGSDSDDNLDLNQHSWTRAGGPLMRTASAAKFVMYYDGEIDSLAATTPATTPQDQPKGGHDLSGDESDANKIQTPRTKLYRPGSGEFRSGNRKNKIWDKVGLVGGNTAQGNFGGNETRSEENLSSSPDDREFGFPSRHSTMRKSASAILERLTASDGDVQTVEKLKPGFRCHSSPVCTCAALGRNAACECSEMAFQLGGRATKGPATMNLSQDNIPSDMNDFGSAEISMREALKATSPQKQFEGLQGRALELGAFGSFVNHEI